MYVKDTPVKSGTVKAFEDAFAREEFLRRTSVNAFNDSCTGKVQHEISTNCNTNEAKTDTVPCGASREEICSSDFPLKEKNKNGLFGMDTGDILIILLIIFFLADSDKENDSFIPILLGILLLF